MISRFRSALDVVIEAVSHLDRPWFNRPVSGLVRSMTSASLVRKFDAAAYIRQNSG